jgi:peptidylprolyl isomerase
MSDVVLELIISRPIGKSAVKLLRSFILGAVTAALVASCSPNNAPAAVQAVPPTVAAPAGNTGNPCIGVQDPPATAASGTKSWQKPDQVIDPTHTYCAIIKTDKGRMVAQLYAKEAPQNVNAFVFLAQQGYYDNLTWHRVLQDFMAQTGDPQGTGMGGPGFNTPLEVVPTLKYDRPGVLGMARSGNPDSAGSQFFITFGPAPFLDPSSQTQGYTVFGQLVEGLDVLNKIKFRDPDMNPTFTGDPLVSIRVVDVVTTQ